MSVVSVSVRRHEFRWVWPKWQPPAGNDLVAGVRRAGATRGWVRGLLAREGDHQYVRGSVRLPSQNPFHVTTPFPKH